MKHAFLAVALATSLFLIGAQLNAASTAAPQYAQDTQAQPSPPPTQATSDATTVFTGKVMQSKGQYVLMESATKTTYVLDDQEKAKAYKGKTVRVTGTLESASNTIHITAIDPS